jgi:hypothetical protein
MRDKQYLKLGSNSFCLSILRVLRFVMSIIIICICIFIFNNSCKKDNTKIIDITMLSNGIWQFQKMELTERNSSVSFYNIDTIYFPAKCDSDNSYIFSLSGIYFELSGKLKCESAEPDSLKGIWDYFKLNNELIIREDKGQSEMYVVDDLSKQTMILVQDTTVLKGKISIVIKKKFYYSKK